MTVDPMREPSPEALELGKSVAESCTFLAASTNASARDAIFYLSHQIAVALDRYAAARVEDERERCAQHADQWRTRDRLLAAQEAALRISKAIRSEDQP